MEKVNGFFSNRANWWYLSVLSLVMFAGFIAGLSAPQIKIDIHWKEQPLADWLVAIGTIGIFTLAYHARDEWLHKKDLENHSEFTQAFYQYFIIKISASSIVNSKFEIEKKIERSKKLIKALNIGGKLLAVEPQNQLLEELKMHNLEHAQFYLEMDQAKEKMLSKACILRRKRMKLYENAVSLAEYEMLNVISNKAEFRDKMNQMFLEIQRVYFTENELICLPEFNSKS